MNIRPTEEFLQACKNVSGIDDDSPGVIIPLMRSALADEINREHQRIVIAKERAERAAKQEEGRQ